MIDIVYNYSKSIAKQLRKNKKVHIAHPSITVTIMRYPKDVLNFEEATSKYVESIVFQHSKLLSERIFFWRTPQKEEVDIVLETDALLPVEVKYKNRIDRAELKAIVKFMEKYSLKKGIIVTKDLLDIKKIEGKEILLIPAWLYLLSV